MRGRRGPTELVFEHIVARSPNSLLRVIVYDAANLDSVRAELLRLGCSLERHARLLAVNVPPTARLADVQAYLQTLEQTDIAGYEEAILRQ